MRAHWVFVWDVFVEERFDQYFKESKVVFLKKEVENKFPGYMHPSTPRNTLCESSPPHRMTDTQQMQGGDHKGK